MCFVCFLSREYCYLFFVVVTVFICGTLGSPKSSDWLPLRGCDWLPPSVWLATSQCVIGYLSEAVIGYLPVCDWLPLRGSDWLPLIVL